MTRLLVLAERPFRDLRSRALLLGLPARFAGATLLLPTAAPACPPGFVRVQPEADPAALGVSRVVLAGAFQERAQLQQALRLATRAAAAGAAVQTFALSVEGGAAPPYAPAEIGVLDAAAPFELRDHHTADLMLVWRVAAPIRLVPYPERLVPPDATLAAGLPAGPLLGVAMAGHAGWPDAWTTSASVLQARLARAAGWPVVPLPGEHPGAAGDDHAGTLAFRAAVLPEAAALLPELADASWRRRQLSPARLKGLVARCALVVTNQDLPAAYAVACGVPVLGLSLQGDRRALSVLTQFANDLAAGSGLIYLSPPSSNARA